MRLSGFCYFEPVLGGDSIDPCPVEFIMVVEPLGPLLSRRKLATKSHFINTAAMNQGSESDIDDAHQTLKYTKAKMRKVLAEIATNQGSHGQPLGDKVSIV